MKKINNIYVIACLHGNEVFGLKVLSHLVESGDERIATSVGNIGAVSKRVRYLESDLNRSFGTMVTPTRESRLAQKITADIKRLKPDLIIDLHTSSVDVGKVAIVAELNPFLEQVAKCLSMDRLAIMLPEITSCSLLGQFPAAGISLEFGKNQRSDKLAKIISDRILNLLEPIEVPELELETYRVLRIVPKQEISGLKYANYEFNPALNGYPFLMGESNYSDYAGFLADKIDSL